MLERLEQGSVVPILGSELLEVVHENRKTRFYPLVAERLATSLSVSSSDLPRGRELQEVARRYLSRTEDVVEIYRKLRVVFRELDEIPIPEPLLALAKISDFKLFVTVTFDVLTERAIDHERFSGQRQTLAFAYSPNDKQDLPPEFDRLNRPAVFHLFGRISGTPHTYALTREDRVAFMQSLESRAEDAPGFLFDKLRRSDLLILGSHATEWLARLFTRDTTGELHTGLDASSTRALFVARFRGRTEWFSGPEATEFVDELLRRWTKVLSEDRPPPPWLLPLVSSPALQSGTVYLSSVEGDRTEAVALRDALDAAGVDVLLDWDDLPLDEKWEKRLRSFLAECALFVPLLSERAAEASRRFQRSDWLAAIRAQSEASPLGRFVFPVGLGGAPLDGRSLPADWGEVHRNENTSDLVRTVVELQRRYRRERFG